jgi:hypothetical protein
MPRIVVLYDACVLYSAPLRDLLMHLAMTSLYQAKWTNEIHDEWIRNVLANRPDLKRSQLERTQALMNRHILDCLVEGYEYLIPSLKLPDPHDRHVLAAAIHSSALIILTYNLKDFPAKSLSPYGIDAQHPDTFLPQLIDLDSDKICNAIKKLRMGLKKPPTSASQYLKTLEKQSLPKTIKKLATLSNLL